MKLSTLGLAAALTFASTLAIAQTGTGSTGGTSTGGTNSVGGSAPGSSTTTPGTTTGSSTGSSTTGMSNDAGSAGAGANSVRNPSGNSYINPSPSGSTISPAPGSGR